VADNLPAIFEPKETTYRGLKARRVLQKFNTKIGEKQIAWVLRNAEGAISFVVMICDRPPGMEAFGSIPMGMLVDEHNLYMPVDLGAHWAIEPPNPEYYSSMDDCFALDGAHCWYEGSGLRAIELLGLLMQNANETVIWAAMYSDYMYHFHGDEEIEE
jgi:hypothetical protein